VARLSTGGPSESRGTDRGEDDEDDDVDVEEESPGVISAFGVPSSELETARRMRGGALSLPLDELLEELFDELLDELPAGLLELSSELELARRSLGRSGSLSLEELDELRDELPELSSELDAARRNVGWLEFELAEELPVELLDESPLDPFEEDEDELSDDLGSGLVSSVCNDASECSSAVPSRTIDIVTAL
jgi:hypothetical protein